MLSIIIVNYKNEQKTIEYIKQEISKISLPHITIVVNNAATSDSDSTLVRELDADLVYDINKIPNKSKNCFIIHEDKNLGFAKGNNLGAEFIAEYVSTVAAAVSIGKSRKARSSIANCCRGTARTAFGFKWKYK
jgi:GT2 family glycosyltransferase